MNQTVHIITSPRGASWRHDPLAWGPKSTPLELLLQKTVPKQLNNPLASLAAQYMSSFLPPRSHQQAVLLQRPVSPSVDGDHRPKPPVETTTVKLRRDCRLQ